MLMSDEKRPPSSPDMAPPSEDWHGDVTGPVSYTNGGDDAPPLTFFRASDFAGLAVPERSWVVPAVIPSRVVTLFSGHGAVGKTVLLLDLMIAMALGHRWLGYQVSGGRTLGVFAEEEREELHRRLAAICDGQGIDMGRLVDLEMSSLAELGDVLAAPSRHDRDRILATPAYDQILVRARDTKVSLAVFDPAANLFDGDENNRVQVRMFCDLLRGLAVKIDGGVVLAAHPSQQGLRNDTGYSGSTAWHNSVRSLIYMTRPQVEEGEAEDNDSRILRHLKCNLGPVQKDITLRWSSGTFVADGQGSGMVDAIERGNTVALFLASLDRLAERNRFVCTSPNSPRYAPKMMMALAAVKNHQPRVRKRDLVAAMDELIDAGVVIITREKLSNWRNHGEILVRAGEELVEPDLGF